eukprot:3276458-Pleurochrysis_carterae.AAC.1
MYAGQSNRKHGDTADKIDEAVILANLMRLGYAKRIDRIIVQPMKVAAKKLQVMADVIAKGAELPKVPVIPRHQLVDNQTKSRFLLRHNSLHDFQRLLNL